MTRRLRRLEPLDPEAVHASELGGDRDLASATVVATTVSAVATLFLVVQVLDTVVT